MFNKTSFAIASFLCFFHNFYYILCIFPFKYVGISSHRATKRWKNTEME